MSSAPGTLPPAPPLGAPRELASPYRGPLAPSPTAPTPRGKLSPRSSLGSFFFACCFSSSWCFFPRCRHSRPSSPSSRGGGLLLHGTRGSGSLLSISMVLSIPMPSIGPHLRFHGSFEPEEGHPRRGGLERLKKHTGGFLGSVPRHFREQSVVHRHHDAAAKRLEARLRGEDAM